MLRQRIPSPKQMDTLHTQINSDSNTSSSNQTRSLVRTVASQNKNEPESQKDILQFGECVVEPSCKSTA